MHPEPADCVTSAGQSIEQLTPVPVTVTWKLQVSALPSSVWQVTTVVPRGKLEPEGGVQAEAVARQPSLSSGAAKSTMARPKPGEVSLTVMSDGQVIVAGCESCTVTLKEHG